tara:strand:+ start:526 stop:687 length:162 start_codon:yes stop_codon:yes gene_type:complete
MKTIATIAEDRVIAELPYGKITGATEISNRGRLKYVTVADVGNVPARQFIKRN